VPALPGWLMFCAKSLDAEQEKLKSLTFELRRNCKQTGGARRFFGSVHARSHRFGKSGGCAES
jgi:hypothetical protein